MKKKLLSAVLTLALILTCLPLGMVSVAAAKSGTTGDCTWTLDGTVLTISGNGKMGDYSSFAPWGTNITAVHIEDGVTSIGREAFWSCWKLTSVTIPGSVTSIGREAFWGCSLTSVAIPGSVTSIGFQAFRSCPLTTLTIPVSVTFIGEAAFLFSDITDVYYCGTETQWKKISIGASNYDLTNATIHYGAILCNHTWQDATCTAPKTCTLCGATSGAASNHTWQGGTCTAPATCSVCGATADTAPGHRWQAATCQTPKTCSVCGTTEGDVRMHNCVNGICTMCNSAVKNGFVVINKYSYYYQDGVPVKGFIKIGEDYYYPHEVSAVLRTDTAAWVGENAYGLPQGNYYFDQNGKMVQTGFATINGNTYYCQNCVRVKGLTKVGEDYYYPHESTGILRTDTAAWVGENSYGLPQGMYYFGTDGKMVLTGFATINGTTYYYQDCVRAKGLTKIGGDYYYLHEGTGARRTDTAAWVEENSYGLEQGLYYFDQNGKMVQNGFVTINGATYYYQDCVRAKGLTKIGGEYYYFHEASGEMRINETLWIGDGNAYGLERGSYCFDANGKMVQTDWITSPTGVKYYRLNAKRVKGLYRVDGKYYYFSTGDGSMKTDTTVYIPWRNSYRIPGGYYTVGSDGVLSEL